MTVFIDTATARARAESLMGAACTIRSKPGAPVTDPSTGEVTSAQGATKYTGKCRVRPAAVAGAQASRPEAGGAELFAFGYLVSVPFAVADVAEGDRVHIDYSPDASLIGIDLEVQRVERGDNVTARRLDCEQVT